MTEYSDNHQPKSEHSSSIVTVNNAPSDRPATLWLIDDDAALRMVLADTFEDAGLTVISFTQAQAAWTRLNDILKQPESDDQLPDVILTDIRMPMMDGLSFSDWVHQHFPDLPIVIMTAHSDLTSAINSYQAGAFEYLPKPFDLDDAVATIYKAINYQPNIETAPVSHSNEPDVSITTHQPPETQIKPKTAAAKKTTKDNKNKGAIETEDNGNPSGIIGQSPAMQTVFRAIGRLAQSPISVLITGESGTGKELVASALHQHSPRKQQPFIALNMAAIPHDLIESELFGHEKGAFTGATTMRQGRFEQADGGTLFLDEIGDMPFSTQTRLLRVLANGEFYRVGGQQPIKVDVRIIAATHQNLEALVKQGRFREDLFYRLNVIRLPLPPLRTRPEDIPALATYFMQSAAEQMNTTPKHLHPAALQIMQTFDWRGNVRQLENVCLWLTVMATGETVMTADLPPELLENIPSNAATYAEHRSSEEISQGHSVQNSDAVNNQNQNGHHQNSQNTYLPKSQSWQQALADWAEQSLNTGETDILQTATPEFERVLLTAALNHSGGKKIEAASLLGWGRNTLTRKIQQLDISPPRVPTKE
ncbi:MULTISPECIES: sigma 54-interacting transcriptional regulator [unclassified Psychrobacter]|uniref:sigma 54-interacting transcriptional regulator n=1 Tax=unclassified Psychrobacter TaxID=196806 RepID=UPI0025B386BF|nr:MULTISPECIES: sigma 54-interacting transcriptional regulator [unclassified Psychrobacter]MDN3453798.1 sigma 54-interacting transcriptional regulator [Psychrobacter sp. APC 3350]MDN3501204.1 sigma 54-interacting transcriptional regulator [Psychrobacter sp. 5A.1]